MTADPGANAWTMISSAMVLLMIPGVGFLYSGLSEAKNALVLLHLCMVALGVVSLQFFVFGFSLAFSPTGGKFLGDFHYAGFQNVGALAYPGTIVSTDVYSMFQMMFAAITAALPLGSAGDRTRMLPSIIFLFIWTTLVYDPIAYWTWAPNGWARVMGYLDFAGGAPVEINSGFAGLAMAVFLGPRMRSANDDSNPHNVSYVVLGTGLLWFGWLGFNGGSANAADGRAGMAVLVTNLAGSAAGVGWMALDFAVTRKYSALGFCTGAIAGLVAITPAAGFVEPWAAVLIGFLASFASRTVAHALKRSKVNDSMEVFAVHGISGLTGTLLTGFFAQSFIVSLDTPSGPAGWLNRHWAQFGYQAAGASAAAAWSFTITYIILLVLDRIPGLKLRAEQKNELLGLDAAEIGESAYNYRSEMPHQKFGITKIPDELIQ
ncbi:ammonium transporter 1 [Blyttiomyces helicus]|uniref:Ammonium transporter n=1 Tax=Blyttiomyces helicus TaxID=388810 RepID=A0A4P9WSM6_9FUNG|nr:ammonium transporter 1 [Blyttiomyces helicus]|eukprot:RKO94026.1 ammonium transporter 1 [Blyttiomyces helicus]